MNLWPPRRFQLVQSRRWGGREIVKLTAMGIQILAVQGCARNEGLGRVLGDELYVCRVRTSGESLSGIPLAANVVATWRDPARTDLDVAVVDSVPMNDCTSEYPSVEGPQFASKTWRILRSSRSRFESNRTRPDLRLAPGQRVLLAGFDASPNDYGKSAYWMRPAKLVEGEIRLVGNDGEIQINAPLGNYQGFVGGPVAILDSTGTVTVFGMIQSQDSLSETASTILHAKRLTEAVGWLDAARRSATIPP